MIILVPLYLGGTIGSSLEQAHSRSGIVFSPCHISTNNISVVLLNDLFPIPHYLSSQQKKWRHGLVKFTGIMSITTQKHQVYWLWNVLLKTHIVIVSDGYYTLWDWDIFPHKIASDQVYSKSEGTVSHPLVSHGSKATGLYSMPPGWQHPEGYYSSRCSHALKKQSIYGTLFPTAEHIGLGSENWRWEWQLLLSQLTHKNLAFYPNDSGLYSFKYFNIYQREDCLSFSFYCK